MKADRITSSELTITEKAVRETTVRLIPPGSVLVVGRSGILKRMLPVSINDVECTVNQDIKVIVPFLKSVTPYLQLMLKGHESFVLRELIKGGVTVQSLKYAEFERQPFPFPPLSEQARIIAEVDQLMALCDELNSKQNQHTETHGHLIRAAHQPLTQARDHAEFNAAWHRIRDHFDRLYTTIDSVKALRQTILQLAVQGKLVPQDPNDEPASVLLEKIRVEKERLVKEGKVRKGKALPAVDPGEVPFEVPEGWVWAHLADVFALVTDGDHQPPPRSESGKPFLVIGNLNKGKVTFQGCRWVTVEYYNGLDWGQKPRSGDILYTVTGSYGIPIPVDCDTEFCVQRHVAIFKTAQSTPSAYLHVLLGSRYALEYSTTVAIGIAQKTVPLSRLRKMPVPIPPHGEQSRIVAKVDQLMTLCDELETKIQANQTTAQHFAEAVVVELAA